MIDFHLAEDSMEHRIACSICTVSNPLVRKQYMRLCDGATIGGIPDSGRRQDCYLHYLFDYHRRDEPVHHAAACDQ
jgi:hypothetical protein